MNKLREFVNWSNPFLFSDHFIYPYNLFSWSPTCSDVIRKSVLFHTCSWEPLTSGHQILAIWSVAHGGLYVFNVAGVGGIEAEAVMLGQAISMVLPKVVGYKLTGQVKPFITSTDVVLTITKVSGTMYTVLKQGWLQGAKKVIFTVCHSGKLKLAFTSPNVISTSPQNFLISRIDFTVLL